MFFPARREILRLCRQGFVVPVLKKIDYLKEPFFYFDKLRKEKFGFLLDSARVHPLIGRYTFFGANPFLIFKSKEREIEIEENGSARRFRGNPIAHLRQLFGKYRSPLEIPFLTGRAAPDFAGGAVGYFSYDVKHFFEALPRIAVDDLRLPDIHLAFYDTIVAVDHFEKATFLISNVMPGGNFKKAYDEAAAKLERLERRLQITKVSKCHSVRVSGCQEGKRKSEFISSFTKKGFEEAVRRAKRYISEGDIYQANLSQRLSAQSDTGPFELYKTLRRINPSPFASFLDFGGFQIVSSSPERLLKLEGRKLQTRPIAGTRPRGKDSSDDKKLSRNLLLSPKERAEHIMLVDLERNDLGRICEYGSVRVDELMVLEKYSHVIHIVSNVTGRMKKDKDGFDCIRALFPGGTITGVPKVRSMEIIEELEPVRRGIYTGSIGYLGFNGDMDLNIAIRTFVLKDGWAHVQVGAGIVADSDPHREYCETMYKAQALLEALNEVY